MYDIFQIPDSKFPKNFLWGASTAGNQIEGDNNNSNRWFQELERPFDPTGVRVPSGKACNHYNMVDEDIQLMKELELHSISKFNINFGIAFYVVIHEERNKYDNNYI